MRSQRRVAIMSMQPTAAQKALWAKCDEREVDGFLDRARQGIHCRLGCGGRKCKHEDYKLHLNHPNVHPAIEGLNSHWVGDLVVASQRPSTSLFIKHMLIEQFKGKRVTGVFNLQEKGEHASCGPDGIYADTGYSYSGENDLMKFGVKYYEFPWPDMTAPENDIVLRSVQCMDHHARSLGRVLVHCHAGLGRTGLMIACFFMLSQRMRAQEAITLVRTCRPGAIQTDRQVQFCLRFESYVRRLAHTFKEMPGADMVTFGDFLQRQFQVLHGEEARSLRYVPRHIFYCLKQLLSLTDAAAARVRALAIQSFAPSICPDATAVQHFVRRMNDGSFTATLVNDVPLLGHLVMEWFRRLDEPFLSAGEVSTLLEALKALPAEKRSVTDAVGALPRAKRHTAGVVLSALMVLSQNLPATHLERALQHVTDAFAQCSSSNPEEQRQFLSPGDRQLLQQALSCWAADVGTSYWDVRCVPSGRRVVGMIASFGSPMEASAEHIRPAAVE
jgi:protein tyrosine phosphatase domain-containing protein 1